jgi:ERCC4-type nuclease
LPVGDGIWIARHKRHLTEYVLDFIVERKNVVDLGSSITDNRYKDQKLRLQVPSETIIIIFRLFVNGSVCITYYPKRICTTQIGGQISCHFLFAEMRTKKADISC